MFYWVIAIIPKDTVVWIPRQEEFTPQAMQFSYESYWNLNQKRVDKVKQSEWETRTTHFASSFSSKSKGMHIESIREAHELHGQNLLHKELPIVKRKLIYTTKESTIYVGKSLFPQQSMVVLFSHYCKNEGILV